ncbi:autotransporter domain-containing protein [Fodinicurvata halophila]|uniref:autotransporter domain-containing protein n=1 Tax=Fodinicurvata halophila TaxID=1419723 RepID=UPI0036418513
MKTSHGLAAVFALLLPIHLLSAQGAAAYESHIVSSPEGRAVFEVRIFNEGDGVFLEDGAGSYESTWNLSDAQKDGVLSAIGRWAEIIEPQPDHLPIVINVGTYDDANAFGGSDFVEYGDDLALTQLQAALQNRDLGGADPDFSGYMALGSGITFNTEPDGPSPLPQKAEGFDLNSTVFHELGHALGILTAIESGEEDDGTESGTVPYFDDAQTLWGRNMRDSNGNPGHAGQFIKCDLYGCYTGEEWNDEDAGTPFDLTEDTLRGRDQGYITGPHVRAVMDGTMPGVPVHLAGRDGDIDEDFMSHSELERSMMSHQLYRNHVTFMEAELAALQDMGYDIDRRNFFGYSIYGDDRDIVNRHAYFRRNETGTAYLTDQYNTATLGMGLHIYGSNNKVEQAADLLTVGAGAAGVRIDGLGNSLVIDGGTRVHANGWNGRAVMFAYGKGHELVQRGEVQALGKNGIGISFDFGGNALGMDLEYRGSWIRTEKDEEGDTYDLPLLEELEGPLVESYDLTGHVAGRAAAIYISDNALVERINVMRGAGIQGDIVSEYDELDEHGNQRLTELSFGLRPDSQGRATESADTGFVFRHDGNIRGQDNLALSFEGGYSSLNGEHEVYEVGIANGATLGGNSVYTLHEDGTFRNAGLLVPGNSIGTITIDGDYVQDANGTLSLEFNSAGAHDQFQVNGDATLDGQLVLAAEPDWYESGWSESLELDDLVSVSGSFTQNQDVSAEVGSPTLDLSFNEASGTYQISVSRAPNAYSQHAESRNAREVGQVLDGLSSAAGSDLQPLYQALDFSAGDGSEVGRTLTQLSPEAYSAMVATSLDREQRLSDMVAAQPLSLSASTLENGAVQGFAVPLGGGLWQDAEGNTVGHSTARYGVLFGAQRRDLAEPDWIWGVHGAFVGQSISVKAPHKASGDTKAFSLGLQAHYQPDERAGPYFHGQLRAGLESGRMERRIQVGNYATTNRGDWMGFTGSATVGGGYLWRMNERLSAGPVASLDYTRLSRPSVQEDGKDATRLDLSSLHHESLRSSLGVRTSLEHDLEGVAC